MHNRLSDKGTKTMKNRTRNRLSALLISILLLASVTSAQTPAGKGQASQPAPQAGSTTVTGSGTPARLSKWMGVSGTSSFVLGDSTVSEDKFGNVGIGTDAPTAKLTVAGMIQTTLGGYKFPDGTVQTTAAVSGLQSITHDATLAGDGTAASPLKVAVPLSLSGFTAPASIFTVSNTAPRGAAIAGIGGDNFSDFGGSGVLGFGGKSNTGIGGTGTSGFGGGSNISFGGSGVLGFGGTSNNSVGGIGVEAHGGNPGGTGLLARGGDADAMNPSGTGLLALPGFGNPTGLAGVFNGKVEVNGDLNVIGNLSKSGGSFKIDHPLDPENKFLYHSFVESPDMMNVYNGNITTNESGEAVVTLPDYFEALNKDFRYQLTVIGTFAQAIVADEIKGNRFVIKTNAPQVKVSWQVTGIRQDAFANKHRIEVEVEKSEKERGYYLMPELFNQPEEKSLEWARDPQRMQELKQHRMEFEQRRKQQ
jgi:hypothetical protein